MNRPPRRDRKRTRNGKLVGDFTCKVCRKTMFALQFERDPRNLGLCMECAFTMFDLLEAHYPIWAAAQRDIEDRMIEVAATNKRKNRIAKLSRGSNDPGWVYFVEQADLIKIGYSVNPSMRIRSYGPTATLLAIHPGTPALEKEIHQRFKRHLSYGREWYRRADEILDYVQDVLAEFGEPRVFVHKFREPKSTLDTPGGKGWARHVA